MVLGRKEEISDAMPRQATVEQIRLNALLGKGSEFEGKLTFEGSVRIDGKFSGEILSNDTLIIGEGAKVKAEITVGTVVIHGQVLGNIRANQAVEIHAPGRLKGNIVTPVLQIERGVIFEGNCVMENTRDKMDHVSQGGKSNKPAGDPKEEVPSDAPPPKM